MEGAIRVLHVDDDPHFRELTVECLEAEGLFLVEPAPSPAKAREKLDERFDCIVSDYEMPDRDGIEFLESVRAEHPDLPFILFTGEGSESIASEAISAGVTDYLQKSGGTEQFTLLANRIRNAVEAARSKRQLGERTRRLETLIDNLPGMVYRCRNEPTWPMENVEGEGEELTGYTADALECGEVVWGEAVLHPDEREEIWTEVQEQLDQTGSFETTYRIRTKHGETKWAWERGRLVDGQVLEGFITDITDRRNRQKELEQYEALIDTVQDGIMVANREFEIETVNRAGAAAMGASPSDIEGENGVDLAAEYSSSEGNPEKLKSAFETTVERDPGADPVTTELEFDLPIGHEFVEYQLTPFRASGEEKIAVIGRNVTDREERERELRRKNERLEKFASVVSHDLRNPLQIASTRLDLAQADCDSEHLGDIERALDKMGQLIDDILTLAREGEKVSETEHVELARASRRSWQQVRAPSSSLDVETERSLDADPNRLDQLLTNLFENAVEHGPANEPREPGSQTAEDESAVTVRVGELTDGFYVADDGTGIPAEDREQIFDEGYSTSAEGTGFGLSIVEEIATAHGWEVDVTESESGGARFEITGIESSGA